MINNTYSGWSAPIPKIVQYKNPRWMKLVPYGVYTNDQSILQLNRESASLMAKRFQSIWSRIYRFFFPMKILEDDESFKTIGYVTAIEARCDGIYFLPKWTDYGVDVLKTKAYKHFTPQWTIQSLGQNRLQPKKLVDVLITRFAISPTPTLHTTPEETVKRLVKKPLTNGLITARSNEDFIAAVHKHMDSTGKTYFQSYNFIKNQFRGTSFTA